MLLYDYTGIDDFGKPHKGQIEAESEKDLEAILSQKGLYLLEAKERHQIVKSQRIETVPTETVPTETHWKEIQGAREIHFHQHIHNVVSEAPKPWSDFTIWTLLWLVFFFPVGLFLLWQKKYTPKWFKITISAMAGLYGLLYLPFAESPSSKPQGYLYAGGGVNQTVPILKNTDLSNPNNSEELAGRFKFFVPNYTKVDIVSISPELSRIKIREGMYEGEEGYVLTDWLKK